MLDRAIQSVIVMPEGVRARRAGRAVIRNCSSAAAMLGRRLGEMHACAGAAERRSGVRARHAATEADCSAGPARRARSSSGAHGTGQRRTNGAAERAARCATELLARRDGTAGAAASVAGTARVGTACTRIHGDLHLGQALVSHGDVYFIDFEGEPARPLERATRQEQPAARRRRHAALVRLRGREWRRRPAGRDRARSPRRASAAIIERFREVSERRFPRRLYQATAPSRTQWR